MGKKAEEKKEDLILSEKSLKIGEFHCYEDYEKWAGVKRVSDANFAALKLHYPNLEPVYIAGTFDNHSLEGKEKRQLNIDFWNFAKHLDTNNQIAKNYISILEGELKEKTQDLDNLFAENLNRGINWIFSKATRNFLNDYDKITISRNHDWIINYGAEIMDFFKGFDKPPFDFFPTNKKVIQASLTSSIKRQIDEYSPTEVKILKNSIICDNFIRKNGKDGELKEIFLKEGIMEDGMRHCGYAVRPDSRKNLEEAVYNMFVLEYITGVKHKLIVPLAPDNETQHEYVKDVKEFAKTWGIPLSIGQASKYLDDSNFNVGHFYHNMDMAITTAIMGGFEYAYVEAIMSGVPLFGRRIREVCEDFEANGMKFVEDSKCKEGCLYDNSILMAEKNHHKRFERLNSLCKDKEAFKKSVKKLNLEMRIDYSHRNKKHNEKIVRNVYGHDVVIKDVIKMFKLPGYKKLN